MKQMSENWKHIEVWFKKQRGRTFGQRFRRASFHDLNSRIHQGWCATPYGVHVYRSSYVILSARKLSFRDW